VRDTLARLFMAASDKVLSTSTITSRERAVTRISRHAKWGQGVCHRVCLQHEAPLSLATVTQ
jgi:hypothetical protein